MGAWRGIFLKRFDVQVDQRGAILLAQDDQRGSLCGPDRQRCRLVNEVLVSAQPPLYVTREGFGRLLLRAHRTGDGQIAFRERYPHRQPQPDVGIEQAQREADGKDYQKGGAAATATAAATPMKRARSASPLVAAFIRHSVVQTHRSGSG